MRAEWKKALVSGKQARAKRRRKNARAERAEKAKVRLRDKTCRFPRCGCQQQRTNPLKAILTVSHDFHKGMGGDPTGAVSIASLMMQLCKWRHQDAPVSRHAGTMQTRYLTPDNNDGPVAFLVDLHALDAEEYPRPGMWFEVGRETYASDDPNDRRIVLDESMLTGEQAHVLKRLAEMTR